MSEKDQILIFCYFFAYFLKTGLITFLFACIYLLGMILINCQDMGLIELLM